MKYYPVYQSLNDVKNNKVDYYSIEYGELNKYAKKYKNISDNYIKPEQGEYLVYIAPGNSINTLALKSISNIKRTLNHEKADIIVLPSEIKDKYDYNYHLFKFENTKNPLDFGIVRLSINDFPDKIVTNSWGGRKLIDNFTSGDYEYSNSDNYSFHRVHQKFNKLLPLLDSYDESKIIIESKFFQLFNSNTEIDFNTIHTYLKSPDLNTKKIGLNMLVQLDLYKYGLDVFDTCLDYYVFDQPLKATSAGTFLANHFKCSCTTWDRLDAYKTRFELFNKEDQIKILNKNLQNMKKKIDDIINSNIYNVKKDINWNFDIKMNFDYGEYTSETLAR